MEPASRVMFLPIKAALDELRTLDRSLSHPNIAGVIKSINDGTFDGHMSIAGATGDDLIEVSKWMSPAQYATMRTCMLTDIVPSSDLFKELSRVILVGSKLILQSSEPIDTAGVWALCDFIRSCTLEYLYLEFPMDYDAVREINAALCMSTIRGLVVVADDNLDRYACMLNNTRLKSFYLTMKDKQVAGVDEFIDALQRNTTLLSLSVTTELTDRTAARLLDAAANSSVQVVELGHVERPKNLLRTMTQVLRKDRYFAMRLQFRVDDQQKLEPFFETLVTAKNKVVAIVADNVPSRRALEKMRIDRTVMFEVTRRSGLDVAINTGYGLQEYRERMLQTIVDEVRQQIVGKDM